MCSLWKKISLIKEFIKWKGKYPSFPFLTKFQSLRVISSNTLISPKTPFFFWHLHVSIFIYKWQQSGRKCTKLLTVFYFRHMSPKTYLSLNFLFCFLLLFFNYIMCKRVDGWLSLCRVYIWHDMTKITWGPQSTPQETRA